MAHIPRTLRTVNFNAAGSVISNTNAETDLFRYNIGGNMLPIDGALVLRLVGVVSTPLVSIPTLTIRAKYGANSITIFGGALVLAAGLSSASFVLETRLWMQGASNSELLIVMLTESITLAGSLGTSNSRQTQGTFATDSTAAQDFAITAQFSGLSVTTSIQRTGARLTIEGR